MFSEILRIRPQLDRASLGAMVNTLNRRFARVANRFRSMMRNAIRGTALGISLSLIARILNPLQAIEERIKSILGQGAEIRDIADRFGTSQATIQQIQEVAMAQGYSKEDSTSMLTTFARLIEEGREEIKDPTSYPSATTHLLRNFLGEKDLGAAFLKFARQLEATGSGPGQDIVFGEREQRRLFQRQMGIAPELSERERQSLIEQGLLTEESGPEIRRRLERLIFGEEQFGASRRFLDTLATGQLPSFDQEQFNRAVEKSAGLSDRYNKLEAARERQAFVSGVANVPTEAITNMVAKSQREDIREIRRLLDQSRLFELNANMEKLIRGFDYVTREFIPWLMNHGFNAATGIWNTLKGIYAWLSSNRVSRFLEKLK